MKILRIIARLNVGGPARHVVWLTKALQDDALSSTLVTGSVPAGERDMGYIADKAGVSPVYISEMSRELSVRDVVLFFKLLRIVFRERPDVVHTHTAKAGTVGRMAGLFYKWATWGALAGRPRKLRLVHTFHGHVFHSYYGPLRTRIFLAIERALARFATDKIVVISPKQLNEIHEAFRIGKREQFAVIPLGIDLNAFEGISSLRAGFRAQVNAENSDIVVGIVGRLTEIKNVSLFLQAAWSATHDPSAGDIKMKFVVVGDGHLRERLEAEADELGLAGHVSFLGNFPEIEEVYSGIDILALTSLNEGTPLSIIEAMAAGLPVIATMVGGVPDLLGDPVEVFEGGFAAYERGIGVPSGSLDGLRKGLLYLAKNEKLRVEMGLAGRAFVTSAYSKERLADDIRELYRTLP